MADRDYDTPETPPGTPPQVALNNDAKSAAEMEAEGEREGPVLKGQTAPTEIDAELGDELAKRDKRDGAGEAELDAMPPD